MSVTCPSVRPENTVGSGLGVTSGGGRGWRTLAWCALTMPLSFMLQIESGTMWKQVYVDLGIPVLNSAASYNVKTAYKK